MQTLLDESVLWPKKPVSEADEECVLIIYLMYLLGTKLMSLSKYPKEHSI